MYNIYISIWPWTRSPIAEIGIKISWKCSRVRSTLCIRRAIRHTHSYSYQHINRKLETMCIVFKLNFRFGCVSDSSQLYISIPVYFLPTNMNWSLETATQHAVTTTMTTAHVQDVLIVCEWYSRPYVDCEITTADQHDKAEILQAKSSDWIW